MSLRDTQLTHNQFKVNRARKSINSNGKVVYTKAAGFWKAATCKDIRCYRYENGWESFIPATNAQMIADIYAKRNDRTWTFSEERIEGGIIKFTFPPGLTCFEHLDGTGHTVPVERDPRFLYRPGGRPTKPVLMDYDQWFDTFNETSYQANGKLKEV